MRGDFRRQFGASVRLVEYSGYQGHGRKISLGSRFVPSNRRASEPAPPRAGSARPGAHPPRDAPEAPMAEKYNSTMSSVCRILVSVLGLALVGVALGACGQRGPLYLPTDPAAKGRATLPSFVLPDSLDNKSAAPSAPAASAPASAASTPAAAGSAPVPAAGAAR
jgi:predicted small lipoprotein YifL